MERVSLHASNRKIIGKQVRALRRQGKLPAIVYGKGIQPFPIELIAREANQIIPSVSSSQLLDLDVDGQMHTVLVRDRQRDPVAGNLLHVDFYKVSMTEKLRASVVIEFVGEAPAVKEYDGILVPGLESIEVECYPESLMSKIEVDISGLREIGDAIYVKDLNVPSGIEVLDDPDEMVALVTAPTTEEEVEAMPLEAGEEPEVIERGKREEEE